MENIGPLTMSPTDGTLKENPHAWSNDYNVTCPITWSFGWMIYHGITILEEYQQVKKPKCEA